MRVIAANADFCAFLVHWSNKGVKSRHISLWAVKKIVSCSRSGRVLQTDTVAVRFKYRFLIIPRLTWPPHLPGLTTNYHVGIVRRLEHGAFLVLACGGALLIEPDAE